MAVSGFSQETRARATSTLSKVFYLASRGRRVRLRPLQLNAQEGHSPSAGRLLQVRGREDASRLSTLVTNAALAKFEMSELGIAKLFGVRSVSRRRVTVLPSVFEDETDRRIRLVYKEVIARFAAGVPRSGIELALRKFGFAIREESKFAKRQYVLSQPQIRYAGVDLLEAANKLAELDEVVFAVPNFVSEFRREALPLPRPEQWHLKDSHGEDVRARAAWGVTAGARRVVIAVLDDGVDTRHPDIRLRLARHPDPANRKDIVGRDFFLPDTHPDHYNPEPKSFRYPYDQMDGNDIHGTPCAGVAAADGRGREKVYGIAPKCRLLPVKVFHGDELATDSRVADAIRYASRCAHVLSCSWSGPDTPDIAFALEDAKAARGGRGAVVCAATGNERRNAVAYPANDPNVIAVGASTDGARPLRGRDRGAKTPAAHHRPGARHSVYRLPKKDAGARAQSCWQAASRPC